MTSRIQNSDIISLQSSLNSNENLKRFFHTGFLCTFFCAQITAVQTCIQLKVDIKQKKENRFLQKVRYILSKYRSTI